MPEADTGVGAVGHYSTLTDSRMVVAPPLNFEFFVLFSE